MVIIWDVGLTAATIQRVTDVKSDVIGGMFIFGRKTAGNPQKKIRREYPKIQKDDGKGLWRNSTP